MSGPALYELLTGCYTDGRALNELSEQEQRIQSVLDSMVRILNARSGAIKHLPDYGLPDLSNIYRHLPASAHQLRHHIRDTLLRYEPRLKEVECQLQPARDELVLCYLLRCQLRQGGVIHVGTDFFPEGLVSVRKI